MSSNSKKVLIYATCQGRMLRDVLYSCNQFGHNFEILDSIRNYDLLRRNESFLDNPTYCEYIKDADLFIYQPLSGIWGSNATDNLIQMMKPGSKTISVPYVYNSGFWPLVDSTNHDHEDEWDGPIRPSVLNKEVIEELRGTKSVDQILEDFSDGKIDFKYVERFEHDLDYLRKKEANFDVKVTDFIESNYKKIRLFNDLSHPTYDVICYMANQIFEILGLTEKVNHLNPNWWLFYGNFIHPVTRCGKDALGLEYDPWVRPENGPEPLDPIEYYTPLIKRLLA